MSPAEVATEVLKHHCPRVVLTGGEPLLQEEDFIEVIQRIRESMPDCQFEVETNGTRTPSPAMAEAVNQFNVSPKLRNSGMEESLRLKSETLEYFAKQPNAWFKFVVAAPEDLVEIQSLRTRFQIPSEDSGWSR